jgi:hypothetical protein
MRGRTVAMHDLLRLRNTAQGTYVSGQRQSGILNVARGVRWDEFDDCARHVGIQKILDGGLRIRGHDKGPRVRDAKIDMLVKSVDDVVPKRGSRQQREELIAPPNLDLRDPHSTFCTLNWISLARRLLVADGHRWRARCGLAS